MTFPSDAIEGGPARERDPRSVDVPVDQAERDRPPVHAAADHLDKATSELREAIDALEVRLAPVLGPNRFAVGRVETAVDGDALAASPLADRLDGLRRHIEASTDRVRSIHQGVEV